MRIALNDKRLEIYSDLKKGLSGEDIARKYGISRVAVWKFVKKLENLGYVVSREKGYKIVDAPDPSPFDLALICKKIRFLKDFYFFDVIDSTNRFAKETNNSIVVARKQTSGRGRLGRRWESEEGGLYMSISMDLEIPIAEIPKLTLLSGLAVCRALDKFGAKIKWPNDVLINGKKVCGILSEFVGEELSSKVVIGIGVNVKNDVDESLNALSLKDVDSNVSINEVFSGICIEFNKLIEDFLKGKWREIVEELRRRSDTIGRYVKVSVAGKIYEGYAIDIDEDGALIIRKSEGDYERVISGECFYTNY